MSQNNNIKYTITFSGDVIENYSTETVINNIASLFGIQATEVAPIFTGTKRFQRAGLNEFTAKSYVRKFKKIGAICYLQPDNSLITASTQNDTIAESKPNKAVLNKTICPKCHSENIDSEKCLDCGIYIGKYNSMNSQSIDYNDADDSDDYEKIENKNKATRIIKYAVFYLIAVFTLDNYTNNNWESLRYVLGSDFTVGFIPYLVGNIALAFGCYYLALAKSRVGYWGLLGLVSVPGLCLLLLLSDKQKISSKVDYKTQLFSYVIIIISIIWAANMLFLNGGELVYITKGAALREQRHEYPLTEYDSDSKLYYSEIKELNNYLDEGFTLLSENEFNHAEVIKIGDTMFSETVRLFIWINYQRYMQLRNGGSGADFLESKNVERQQVKMFKKIQAGVLNVSKIGLNKSFGKWFTGDLDEGYKEMMTFTDFFSDVFKLRRYLQGHTRMKSLPFEPPNFIFDEIKLPKFKTILVDKMIVEDDKLVFTFSNKAQRFAGKTYALGYFYEVEQRLDRKSGNMINQYSLKVVQLSADFPIYIVFGDTGVFNYEVIGPLTDDSLK